MELLTTATPGGMPIVVHGDMDDPLSLSLYVGGVMAVLPRNVVHQLQATMQEWLQATREREGQ
jgi:hypothetical protein